MTAVPAVALAASGAHYQCYAYVSVFREHLMFMPASSAARYLRV